MYEELQTHEENIIDTGHDKILVLKNGQGNNWDKLLDDVSEIVDSAKYYDYKRVTQELKKFIPEYVPDNKTLKQRLKSSIIEEI